MKQFTVNSASAAANALFSSIITPEPLTNTPGGALADIFSAAPGAMFAHISKDGSGSYVVKAGPISAGDPVAAILDDDIAKVASFAPVLVDGKMPKSCQWTASEGTGAGHAAVGAVVAAQVPKYTVQGLINAILDEQPDAQIIVDQLNEKVFVFPSAAGLAAYVASVLNPGDAPEAVSVVLEPGEESSTAERLFGE